jgi:hypothetical protein
VLERAEGVAQPGRRGGAGSTEAVMDLLKTNQPNTQDAESACDGWHGLARRGGLALLTHSPRQRSRRRIDLLDRQPLQHHFNGGVPVAGEQALWVTLHAKRDCSDALSIEPLWPSQCQQRAAGTQPLC